MQLKSWDDWFKLVEQKTDDIKKYEESVLLFLNGIYKNNDNLKKRILLKPLNSDFYKESLKSIKPFDKLSIVISLISFLVLLVILSIISGITFYKAQELKFSIESISVFFSGIGKSIIKNLVIAVISCIVINLILFFYKKVKYSTVANKIKKQGEDLTEFLQTIPPKYRNYESLAFISELYFQYPYVTFSQAIDATDNYLREHSISEIRAIMYDIPYGNLSLSTDIKNENSRTVENIKKEQNEEFQLPDNENLPSDIMSKISHGSDDAQKDLNAMIGLDDVKQQIERLKNRISFYGAESGNSGNHMVFMGSAGTGKSVCSRIITKILYDFGYIKENKLVEIDGDYLKSPYVGQTGDRTSAIVEAAMGGVLFIDEAYLLYDKSNTAAEATGVLLKAMEDRRKDFVVILAGYEEQMTKLLASNEGFASRIKHKIIFPDYTVDEMYQIFTLFLSKYRDNRVYLVDEDAKQLLLKNFEQEKKSKSFGNARTVRNAVDAIMDYHADRMVNEQRKSDDNKITIDDIKPYYENREKQLKQDARNVAASNQLDESIIKLSDLKQKIKEGSKNWKLDIDSQIGAEDIKQRLLQIQKEKEFYGTANVHNFIFSGSNENLKNSVISSLTGFLFDNEFIRENRYLEISAEFLKGSYVGHTSRRVESIISYAKGGVLYVKNVNLLNSGFSQDSFGQEALTTLSSMITTDDLVIILSDTENNIQLFLKNNPEIENSIENVFIFKNYTADEQFQIFNFLAKKEGFTIDSNCQNKLYELLQGSEDSKFVFTLYNEVKKNHMDNYIEGENKYLISEKDFPIKKKLKFKM